MEKSNLILVAVLVVMVAVAGVQAIQFNGLANDLKDVKSSGTTLNTVPAPTSSGSGSGNTPSVLSNLPAQVGGC